MDDLVNHKLTRATPDGTEGLNNKFNGIVNSLEQQGHKLVPKLLTGIYLENISQSFMKTSKTKEQPLAA